MNMLGDLLRKFVERLILNISLKVISMQCKTPTIVYNRDFKSFIYTPCGNCYACQCNKRAEWVLRSRCEYDKTITNGGCSYFCTFTYDDDHLYAPHLPKPTRQLILNTQMLRAGKFKDVDFDYLDEFSYLDYTDFDQLPDYGDFILNTDHASELINNIQTQYRSIFHPDEYKAYLSYQRKASKLFDKDEFELACYYRQLSVDTRPPLFRYYLVGEYGDLSNRPHLHSLFFIPEKISEMDIANLLKTCWSYGNIYVGYSVEVAAINYVAKHQVKDCLGSEFQQKVAPIFARSSRYNGGIGYDLRYDPTILYKYENMETEEQSIRIEDGCHEYYFSFPRYVKKFLHPLTLTYEEFSELSRETTRMHDDLIYRSAMEHGIDLHSPDLETQVYRKNYEIDSLNRERYKQSKLLNKKIHAHGF